MHVQLLITPCPLSEFSTRPAFRVSCLSGFSSRIVALVECIFRGALGRSSATLFSAEPFIAVGPPPTVLQPCNYVGRPGRPSVVAYRTGGSEDASRRLREAEIQVSSPASVRSSASSSAKASHPGLRRGTGI